MTETNTNKLNQETGLNEAEAKALKKLIITSRLNKLCIISLFISLTIMCITAFTMFAEVAVKIILLLFEKDKPILSKFLNIDVFVGRISFFVFIPFAIVSGIFILVYSIVLKINENGILEVMSNSNLENWYKNQKFNNNSLYLFRYMYNKYASGKLKTELNQKQKKVFRGLNTILYPDSYCLEDMDGFCYELYMGSFFDILVRLCKDPSDEAVKEIIDDYSEERNLENLKKRNKKNIKENNLFFNKLSWKFYFYIFKVGIFITMILWLIKDMFFPETESGVFYANYFNICAAFLLGTELWERRRDFLFFNKMDDIGTKKKP